MFIANYRLDIAYRIVVGFFVGTNRFSTYLSSVLPIPIVYSFQSITICYALIQSGSCYWRVTFAIATDESTFDVTNCRAFRQLPANKVKMKLIDFVGVEGKNRVHYGLVSVPVRWHSTVVAMINGLFQMKRGENRTAVICQIKFNF